MKRLLYGMIAVATIFSLAGCGKKEETTEPKITPNETTTQTTSEPSNSTNEEEMTVEEAVEQLPEETIEGIQETLDNIEVSSDKNTISFQQDEKTTAIYHHDGEKVNGFEAYIEYDKKELAEAAKAEGEADEEAMEDVESVTVEGNKLHVIFKESAYQDTSLEEIQQAVALIQALQEAN